MRGIGNTSNRFAAPLILAAATATIMLSMQFDDLLQVAQQVSRNLRELKDSKEANAMTAEARQTYPVTFRADLASNLIPVHSGPEATSSSTATPFFWHIPKAGGSSAKYYYVNCRGIKLAHYDDDFDIVSRPGVMKAKAANLVPSHSHDMLMSALFHPAIDLFDSENKGRAFAMFRHPVDIVISTYYYLQTATWEPGYDPKLGETPIEEFAAEACRRDWITKNLAGVVCQDDVTQEDFEYAKQILGDYFLVGLTSHTNESTERFDKFFGIPFPTDPQLIENCPGAEHASEVPRENGNKHPKVERGSDTWNKIAMSHEWDSQLYDFIESLYNDQSKFFDGKKDTRTGGAEYEGEFEQPTNGTIAQML